MLTVPVGGPILKTELLNLEPLQAELAKPKNDGHSAPYGLAPAELSQVAGGSALDFWQLSGTPQFATGVYQGALDVRSGPISPGYLPDLRFTQ